MSDPIKDLENFDHQGLPMNPLTPAEVRRRGDRMRRRNNGVLALGAAAAVAVIATSGVLVGNAVTDRAAEPGPAGTTSPSPTEASSPSEPPAPLTEIPGSFPLDAGIEGAKVSDGAGMSTLDYCGRTPLADLDPVDVRTAGLHGGETAITRTLLLLDSPESALAAHNKILDAAWNCTFAGGDTRDSGDVEIQPTVPTWPGDTIVEDFGPGAATEPTVEVVNVVNKGSALLVTSIYGVWSDDHEAGVSLSRETLRPVVEAMDVFGEQQVADHDQQGSDTGTDRGRTSASPIADDFPLEAGWPDDSDVEPGEKGLTGPNRRLAPVEFAACGETWSEPEYADRLRADWSNVEDYRSRQLTTYASVADARAAVSDLVETLRACPADPERESDGYVTTRDVRRATAGDEAWAILERDTLDGSPSPFGATLMVVRDGRAVLVMINGGHGGYPNGDGQANIDEMLDQATPVIDELCTINEAPC